MIYRMILLATFMTNIFGCATIDSDADAALKSNGESRVEKDLKEYLTEIKRIRNEFKSDPERIKDVKWVQDKLAHMVQLDQYTRKFSGEVYRRQYSNEESELFLNEFMPHWVEIDEKNTADLKRILAIHEWIRISKFGAAADNNAWLLVQHADRDRKFQNEVLTILTKHYPSGETSRRNFAYLFDRVASAEARKQRYGTQGSCVGPGLWEPNPVEDPSNLEKLRSEMTLETMAEYKKMFKDICLKTD